MFDQSLRLGILETVHEEAQYSTDRWNEMADNANGFADDLAKEKGKSKAKAMSDLRSELEENERVRRAFRAALRVQPDEADVARVRKAIAQLEDDGDL